MVHRFVETTIRLQSANAVALAKALKAFHPSFANQRVPEALATAREQGQAGIEFTLPLVRADQVLAELVADFPDIQAIRVKDTIPEPAPILRPKRSDRFNGDDYFPPATIDRFPNWMYALDEEGDEGQDETTIKPADNQTAIVPYDVCLTAGDAVFATGATVPVLIDCGYNWVGSLEDIQAVRILTDEPEGQCRLSLVMGAVRSNASRQFIEAWREHLPVTVTSRLAQENGKRIRFRLDADAAEIVDE